MTRSYGRGLTDEYVKEVLVRVNERKTRGVTYRVVESGLHVFVEDALTDPLLHGLYDLVRAQGYRALLAVPMFHEERVIGSVNLYYNQRRKVSEDEIAVAQAFAVAREPTALHLASQVPYVIAVVELLEGPHLTANILHCEVESVAVGMAVRAEYVDISPELTLVQFRPESAE